MDKFQDVYREAVEALPKFRMEASEVKDELHHYKMKRRNRNYMIVKGCTAASIFLLCGVGTVAAKSYRDSIIQVNDRGVVITAQDPEEASPAAFSIFDQIGGVFSIAEAGPEEELEEAYELDVVEYSSLKEFLAREDVTLALPDKTLFKKDFAVERVSIVDEGRDITVQLYNDDYSFCMTQFDKRQLGFENF